MSPLDASTNSATSKAATAPLNAGAARTTFLNPATAGGALPQPAPGPATDGYRTTLAGKLPALAALNSEEQAKINSLPPSIRLRVLNQNIADGMDPVQLKQQVITNLEGAISDLVPGGVTFTNQEGNGGATWQVPELADMYKVVSAMPAQDRQMLSGIDFARQHQLDSQDLASAKANMDSSKDLATDNARIFGGFSTVTQSGGGGLLGGIKHLWNMAKSLVESALGVGNMDAQTGQRRQVVLTDAGVFGIGGQGAGAVIAHELGIQEQDRFGRWSPDLMSQFAALSGWTKGPDGKWQAASEAQFVRNAEGIQYSSEAPFEDFAESYATYLMDPGKLLAEAPDKFLFLNAYSGKYTTDQVAGLATMDGVDLNQVATRMIEAGTLQQDVIDQIVKVNGLKPKATGMGGVGAAGDPLATVNATIARHVAAGDTAFVGQLLKPPSGTLAIKTWGTQLFGATWSQLSPAEQEILQDTPFVTRMVDDIQQGQATAGTVENEEQVRIYQVGEKTFLTALLGDPNFRTAFAQNPVSALQALGCWDELPPNMQQAMEQHPDQVAAVVAQLPAASALSATETANIDAFIDGMSPDQVTGVVDMSDANKFADTLQKIANQGVPYLNWLLQQHGPCI